MWDMEEVSNYVLKTPRGVLLPLMSQLISDSGCATLF